MSTAQRQRLSAIRRLRNGLLAALPILDAVAKGKAVDTREAWIAADRARRALARAPAAVEKEVSQA